MQTKTIKSAISGLKPVLIQESGLPVSDRELQKDLTLFSELVYSHSQNIWTRNAKTIETEVLKLGTKRITFKQDFLRNTCKIDTKIERKPRVLTGNIREICEHKILTESESWIRNPNPYKQSFTFNKNIDLSATNDQLSKRLYSSETNTILVTLRCLEKTYLLTFQLPKYLENRAITKLSKPRIRLVKPGEFVFDFTLEEKVIFKNGKQKAGVDLGKIYSYTAAVTTENHKILARYYPSNQLSNLWQKYYRLSELANNLYKKIAWRKYLGLDTSLLETEYSRVKAKKTRLHAEASKQQAAEVARKLAAHDISHVKVENLKWLKTQQRGQKQKSGRWSFSRQQSDLEHALARAGSLVKRVNPRDSSQACWKCSSKVSYRKNRSVWCSDCKSLLDRDFNAALNLATENHLSKKKFDRFSGFIEASGSVSPQIEVISLKEVQSVQLFE